MTAPRIRSAREHSAPSASADDHEPAAVARLEVRHWLASQGAHLVAALVTSVSAHAWERVSTLSWRLYGVGLVGQLADAERDGDEARARELEQAVRARRRAA